MAPLSCEKRQELIAASREAAAAFIEDLPHLREVVAKNDPTRAEIRRLSAVLRRLLVERDLALIADPRLGRVEIRGPDLNSAYKAEKKIPFMFFASGRAKILGGWAGSVWAYDIVSKGPFHRLELPVIHADLFVTMRLDTFLTQRVLCYRGEWVSRAEVIKYVANVASGVHSGAPKDRDQKLLARIRGAVSYTIRGAGVHLDMFPKGVDTDDENFVHAPDAFDPVLVELLAAAMFLVESPLVAELEKFVQAELNAQ